MKYKIMAALAATLFAFVSTSAQAHYRHHSRHHYRTHHVARVHHARHIEHTVSGGCVEDNNGRTVCGGSAPSNEQPVRQTRRYASSDDGTIIGARPAGCPRAYCGCGARKYLGIDDSRLNLAWNWTKYYHGVTPVAVWRHHVAIIESWTGRSTAILVDFNSGGGLSRRHERSVAGARIVGGGLASL